MNKASLPNELVRFHIHVLRDHAQQLVEIAEALTLTKGRDTRLGEALELALNAGLKTPQADILKLAKSDAEAPYWVKLGQINRHSVKALTPAELNR